MKRVINFFKQSKDSKGILQVHPMTALVLIDMLLFINTNGQKAEVTSFIRDPHHNRLVGAKSETHVDGRAFDLHCKTWPAEFLKEFVTYFSHKYKGHGAISSSTGEEKLIVVHGEGENLHCHVQLSLIYNVPDCWKDLESI